MHCEGKYKSRLITLTSTLIIFDITKLKVTQKLFIIRLFFNTD